MNNHDPILIGTRGSPLALAQARETKRRLIEAHNLSPELCKIIPITTTGDRIQDRALNKIGGKGLFTREIEDSLLDGTIDIAVHSMKDMPVIQPEGLMIACFLPREDPRDVLLGPASGGTLSNIPKGSKIGTSSLRRAAQLRSIRPDLQILPFRGNVQTRLRKLQEGIADASFLALAGLNRLSIAHEIPHSPLSPEEMLPAIAQGIIGIEQRRGDDRIAKLLAPLNHIETESLALAERAFLSKLDGSCQTPIAGLARIEGDEILLRGEVLRPDGSERYFGEIRGKINEAISLGEALGGELLGKIGPYFFLEQ